MIQTKLAAVIFSITVGLAVLSPVTENWAKKPADDFPLSYYPMFSARRDVHYSVNYLVGHDSLNNRHIIPYKFIGRGGFNQVRRQLNRNVKRKKYKSTTHKVAKKVSKSRQPPFTELKEIHLVKGTYNMDVYFTEHKMPAEEETLFIQPIKR